MIIIKSIIIIKYEMILRARIDFYPNACYFRDVVCFYTIRYMPSIWVGCKKHVCSLVLPIVICISREVIDLSVIVCNNQSHHMKYSSGINERHLYRKKHQAFGTLGRKKFQVNRIRLIVVPSIPGIVM